MIPLRVLIVDDTTDMRRLLRSLLEATGRFVVVGEAANGRTAITMTEELEPDAIVLDLAMPVLDGLQAIPRLRDAAPDAAIVVFSGFEMGRAATAAIQAGADRYVEKGTAIAHLADEIDAARAARPQTPPSVAPAPPAERPAAPVSVPHDLTTSLSRVAHDLRTPLTVMAGAVRTLETRWQHLDDGDRAHLIALLRRATDRMNTLVGDIDEAARIEAGEMARTATRFDLRALIERAVEDARVAFPARRFAIGGNGAPQLVTADHGKQAQILQTLLARIARATDTDAVIEVAAVISDEIAQVSLSHWSPSTSGGEATEKGPTEPVEQPGPGLDLTIARSYIEADGGVLEIRQTREDGASFTYTIPTQHRAEIAS